MDAIPAIAGGVIGGVAQAAKGPAATPTGLGGRGGGGGFTPSALRFSEMMGSTPEPNLTGALPQLAPSQDEGMRLQMLLRQLQGQP